MHTVLYVLTRALLWCGGDTERTAMTGNLTAVLDLFCYLQYKKYFQNICNME